MKRIGQFFARGPKNKFVGKDSFGNKFFVSPVDPNKRFVEHPKDVFEYNPNDIHILWNQWLRRSLKEAPTKEEIELFDKQQVIFKQNIKEFELKDKKLRLKEQRDGFLHNADTSSGPASLAQQFLLQQDSSTTETSSSSAAAAPPPPSNTSMSDAESHVEEFDFGNVN
eukprot:CAMPEP_0168595468 /NCGR_PEP_ID=MMETSP0420-20121227/9483_1 /TAXON_ID=498008 /ORGANISM="Pessonella sp." /LENGTH=167 /DNA_ID=CAMNT_0008631927 /DNA_START=38 /DNA_END=538 /DNA_ORIENTATION=+